MTGFQKGALLFLRVAMGWLFFYAGYVQLIAEKWSAENYIKGAKNFQGMYFWLLRPEILPIINQVNKWALILLGVSLIVGAFVRLSASLGVVLMLLYYFVLSFPQQSAHGLVVDEHIIYIGVLVVLAAFRAGRFMGMDSLLRTRFG